MSEYGLAEYKGQYWKMNESGEKTQISPSEYAQIKTAQDTGWGEAGLAAAGERFASLINKLPGVDNFLGVEDNQPAMDALKERHPVSTTVGTMAPYLAAAPLAGPLTIPRAIGAGAVESGAFALPGEGVQDTIMGGLFGGAGHMTGRVLQKLLPEFEKTADGIRRVGAWEKPAQTTKQILTGKQGFFDKKLANTIGGAGPANIFARENQKRLNQVAAEAMGFDPTTLTKITPTMSEGAYHTATKQVGKGTTAKMGDIIDAEVSAMVNKASDTLGNVSPGKMLGLLEKTTDNIKQNIFKTGDAAIDKQNQMYADLLAERLEVRVNKLVNRVNDLSDPKKGLLMPTNPGTSEEIMSDVLRGVLPVTGWASYMNYLPSMVPIGKGGNIGGHAGMMSGGLLDQVQATYGD